MFSWIMFKAGISSRVIAGISIAGVAGALLFASFIYFRFYKKNKVHKSLLSETTEHHYSQHGRGNSLVNCLHYQKFLVVISQ